MIDSAPELADLQARPLRAGMAGTSESGNGRRQMQKEDGQIAQRRILARSWHQQRRLANWNSPCPRERRLSAPSLHIDLLEKENQLLQSRPLSGPATLLDHSAVEVGHLEGV